MTDAGGRTEVGVGVAGTCQQKQPPHGLRATAALRLSGNSFCYDTRVQSGWWTLYRLLVWQQSIAKNAVERQAIFEDVASFRQRVFPGHT